MAAKKTTTTTATTTKDRGAHLWLISLDLTVVLDRAHAHVHRLRNTAVAAIHTVHRVPCQKPPNIQAVVMAADE